MSIAKWTTVGLCLLQGGYMVLDGGRALVVGSYITPGSGEHRGKLGPWADVVSRVGIPPESLGMKIAFVVLGMLWLALAALVTAQAPVAWPLGLALAVGTLWYLVPGTVISLLVAVLLLTPGLRQLLNQA